MPAHPFMPAKSVGKPSAGASQDSASSATVKNTSGEARATLVRSHPPSLATPSQTSPRTRRAARETTELTPGHFVWAFILPSFGERAGHSDDRSLSDSTHCCLPRSTFLTWHRANRAAPSPPSGSSSGSRCRAPPARPRFAKANAPAGLSDTHSRADPPRCTPSPFARWPAHVRDRNLPAP